MTQKTGVIYQGFPSEDELSRIGSSRVTGGDG